MATSRNLWPLGIILTLGVFIAGTAGLIVMACSQRVELVSPDYYERELKFQSQIDEVERTHRAATQASVAYDAAGKCITVSLPADQARREVTGSIKLYRPSAIGMDQLVKLEPDANGTQRLDASGLAPGLWRVRVSWTAEKQNYYLEQKVVVGSKPS
jgi:nitrogen fixation protein FixH